MKTVLRSIVLSVCLLPVHYAQAYGQFNPELDGQAARWNILPVQVIVDGGTLFGQGNGFSLVQQAVSIWNSVDGVPVLLADPIRASFDYTQSNIIQWGISDGVIRVIFDEGGLVLSSNGYDPTSGLLGVGMTKPDINGFAESGVVVINGHSSVSGSAGLLGVIVHEFGHVLGLTHTPIGFGGFNPPPQSSTPTMYPFAGNYDAATLEVDDTAGIRAIYAP